MKLSDFDFEFPQELIAQYPLPYGESRMLAVQGFKPGGSEHTHDYSKNLINYIQPGDGIVLNNTRVIPARLYGQTSNGGKVEVLLLKQLSGINCKTWEVMVKPGKKCRQCAEIIFSREFSGEVREILPSGNRLMEFNCSGKTFNQNLESFGKTPLPPYIKRNVEEEDKGRYQSVFSEKPGSVAAPTASLHFSADHIAAMEEKGIEVIKVTLHIGAGTFLPVKTEDILEHNMHEEWYEINDRAVETINKVKKRGNRIWAVGTTASRILETVALENGMIMGPSSGVTDKYIYPGYKWKIVDGLLTNFHWPKSTLYILVCSILGTESARKLYQDAVSRRYRLFSYGDSMLIY